MPFAQVDTRVDFPALERETLAFWDRIDAFGKLRAKMRGKPPWSFLDGPITANNPMGVHHAWGRTYKDAYQRYFAMTGHELRYQNGFDCQGLWVEVEVEKELNLESKRDIENLVPGDRFASIDKFVRLCKERVDKFARIQTDQSIRLGYWMDWDRTDEDWAKAPGERKSYFTMSQENNYTIWTFLKKCHERGLIYRAYDSMPWCPRCAVGVSQMEMHEGYQMVADRSVFVKFRLTTPGADASGSPDASNPPCEFLLIWTTTPWTLTSNVAAAVNPDLTYLKVKHKDEIYYLAKGALTAQRKEDEFKNKKEWVEGVPKLKTLEQIFKEKGGFEIVGEINGKEMVGWTYDGPFDELAGQNHEAGFPADIAEVVTKQGWGPKASSRESHRVIAWNVVGEEEGTGIVHIAPGCGKEDFLLGKEEGLAFIAPLDEEGNFLPGFGELEGQFAVHPETTDWILRNLQEKDILLATEHYPHSYPHCWRCKQALLFRLVDEWFIDMSWRGEIMNIVEQVTFLPEAISGKARELDWLKNMGDWMISKKRFWGLALPIWMCEACGWFDVIGSQDELTKRAAEGLEKFAGHPPHRPWVDLVKIECGECGEIASRIPDVGNPWLDAGIVPFSTVKYNTDREYWEKWFPADFITESFPGQFRNWFYAILAMSAMMVNRPPFKVLLGHGQVRDQWGDEMHKSWGNAIPFEGAADGAVLEGSDRKGYQIKHELKSGEQPTVPGALAVKVNKEMRHDENVRVAVADCPAMSADLIRWVYCRHNSAHNINFGPGPAEEIRNKFIMKLWNTYAFFCNYARLDEFRPANPRAGVAERPDIDRWILSDLQKLIQKAHAEFANYNIQMFCLEAEDFVDNRLSNWYVRRNRRRFWKSERGADKLAAYETLYTVLMTLTKLFAPILPFLTETIYQNLKTGDAAEESIHHCTFPIADEALIDEELSSDMQALLRLVSLGSAVRNIVKIKVRQPLAELRIQPGDERERNAANRFADQICEELNLKKVALHDAKDGTLLKNEIRPNMKSLGPKFGPRLKDVQKALAGADADDVAAKLDVGESISLSIGEELVTLDPEDLIREFKAENGWTGLADRKTQLALDARITDGLKLEGLAREVVRHVQTLRKEAGLALEDRIVLHLHSDSEQLTAAIAAHRDYLAQETLVREWSDQPLGESAARKEVKIEGMALEIQLKVA